MKLARLILFAFCLIAISCSGDNAKGLLETALFEEQQTNLPHAKQLYEEILRLYPDSPEATIATARLADLSSKP